MGVTGQQPSQYHMPSNALLKASHSQAEVKTNPKYGSTNTAWIDHRKVFQQELKTTEEIR